MHAIVVRFVGIGGSDLILFGLLRELVGPWPVIQFIGPQA